MQTQTVSPMPAVYPVASASLEWTQAWLDEYEELPERWQDALYVEYADLRAHKALIEREFVPGGGC